MGGYWDEHGNYIDTPIDNTGYPIYPPPHTPTYFPIHNVITDYSAATYNLLLEIKKLLETLIDRTPEKVQGL